MSKRKFFMSDENGKYKIIPTNNTVKAIYYAWNYEEPIFERESNNVVFTPFEDHDFNNYTLGKYGLRIIEHEDKVVLQSIKTKQIYTAPWEKG